MTTSRPGRTRLAESALLALLIAPALSAGALPADRAADAPAPLPSAIPGSPAGGSEVDALRDAIWDLERHLRRRLAAAERQAPGVAGAPQRPIGRLTARLHALRRAARTLGEPAATELARKAAALRPLIAEVERIERSGVAGAAGSAWSLAGRRSTTWVDAAAHGACRDARKAGEGVLTADTARAGARGALWLRYAAAAGGYITVDTAGSRFDTLIEVYDACSSAGGAPIAAGDDETGLQARVAFRAIAGATYWLRVGGWGGSAGALVVDIEGGVVAGFAGIVVREVSGEPVFSLIEVWDSAGSFVTSVDSESEGVYVVVGVTPGTYFASTDTFSSTLADELYDDLPCPGGAPFGCDPTSGTPIVVPPDDIVTGIDFALGDGSRIAGRVRDAATGLPLESVEVNVFDEDGDSLAFVTTDVGGRYLAQGLGEGFVFARAGDFSGSEYQRELYQDIPCPSSCDATSGTPIPVSNGTTTSGIDFDLDRLGSIAGTVTHTASGLPVPFVELEIFDDEGDFVDSVSANSQGEYVAGGLAAGTYFVTTASFEYLDELYDDLPCFPNCDPTTGTPVPVTLGEVTPGIDFALDRLATISGAVTDAVTSAPIPFFSVRVFDSSGAMVVSDAGSGGSYLVPGLLPGTYFVIAGDFEDEYLDELYDDLPCPAPDGCDPTTGTPVAVQLNDGTEGIDFALAPLGSIAGTVTASDTGTPLNDFTIEVRNSAGELVAVDFFFGGDYEIGGLQGGTYFVTAEHFTHVAELYDDLPCPGGPPRGCDPTTGTPVAVTEGATTAGVDFALGPEGSISGTVRDALTTAPLGSAEVRVFDDDGSFVNAVFADDAGHYEAPGLVTGTYFVRARAGGHSQQLYDGLPCPGGFCDPTTGTPVPVVLGEETGGIDFDLPPFGSISGILTSTLGLPVQTEVRLFDSDGDFRASAFSAGDGHYTLSAEAGTWFVTAGEFDFDRVLYDGIPCPSGCDPTTGTPVPILTGGATTGIDFVLEPARGITGVITDSAGNPLPGVVVDLWRVSGDLASTAVTGTGGGYVFRPSPGTYFVSTDNGLGATDEVWDDIPCPLGPAHQGLCDPTAGDPVLLPDFTSLVPGIDFALSGLDLFADGFESGDTSAWTSTVE